MMSFVTALKISIEYLASVSVWSILNPYGLVQTLHQSIGQFIAIGRSIIKSVVYDDSTSFILPFEGFWKVYNGGVNKQTSHSWNLIGQRYAYDFVVVDDLGKTYQGAPNRPENYLAFGRPILAASDGTVVDVRNDIKDYHRAGTGWVDIKTPDIRGNYVVIEHSNHTYTLYAHLKSGSIKVKKGEIVVTGQKIGECGHSGHSSEPHLHFQLQDRADFYTAVSLPIRFKNIERVKDSSRECIERGFVARDQMVRNVNTCLSGIIETAHLTKPGIADLAVSFAILLLTILGIFVIVARVAEMILNII
ncbi:MAG: M23 family metallopeptidase [Caldilinea sp.]